MAIELKKFRNKYDLELIVASNENIILGTLVWDPIFGKPVLDAAGVPDHIYNPFASAGYITLDEMVNVQNDFKSTPLVKAGFAEMVIDMDISVVTSLEYPEIGKLEGNFDLNSAKKFSFGDLKARTLSNLHRVETDMLLDRLKKNNWEDYDGRIRRVFMITELYYGSVKMVIEKNLEAGLDLAIEQLNMGANAKVEVGNSVEYTFDHNDVPFAMRIEKVREFNG